MAAVTVPLPRPPGFNLRSTVRSHGWSDLPPFETDPGGNTLVIRLGRVRATARERRGALEVRLESARPLGKAAQQRAVDAVSSCLRLDLDLEPFWALCRRDPALAWAAELSAGRFLRAPTAFADAAMTLATTNCSWALTRRVVRALVDSWGEDGSFPSQAALAAVPVGDLRRHGRLGYRAPFLAALARGPDLEALRRDAAPTAELFARLVKLPGFGPYAAGSFLRSLGRFEHLALDSWVVRAWRKRYPRRKATEAAIARSLRRYGAWRGLAFWLLVTEHWYSRETWRDKF